MSGAARLVTLVEVDDRSAGDHLAVSARTGLELVDGGRVQLLDDRGWGSSGRWATTSVDDVRATALVVVGPDEPSGDRSAADMATDHRADLEQVARRHGVVVPAAELRHLPHDVVLGPQLLARLAGGRSEPRPPG